jgi:hypothetical protein
MSNLAPCRKGLQAHYFEPKGGEKPAIVTTALTDHGSTWALRAKDNSSCGRHRHENQERHQKNAEQSTEHSSLAP